MVRQELILEGGGFKRYSDPWFLSLYLKHGSVESVLTEFNYSLPISVAEYHRLVRRYGIVKGDGRGNTSVAETLYIFLHRALEPTQSLEKLYHSVPPTVRAVKTFPALPTIYRVYDSVLKGVTRRMAVGAIITPSFSDEYVLVADEMESKLSSAKQKGDCTVPFGFASKNQPIENGLLRVLQREFSSDLALEGKLTLEKDGKFNNFSRALIPDGIEPFLEFQILDIKLHMCHIKLPPELDDLSACSSFTVRDHRFMPLSELINNEQIPMRIGMREVLSYYKKTLENPSQEPSFATSYLNQSLLAQSV